MKIVAVLYPGSVAEHAAMQILALVRNFIPAYKDIVEGGWTTGDIAAGVRDSLMSFIEGGSIRDDYVSISDGEIQSGSYRAIYG